METPKKNHLGELSDEELGRLVREKINQNRNIEEINNTYTQSQDNWFRKQLQTNHLNRFFDGLQHKAEKDLGIDDD
jgi:hypothetical protein